MARHYWKDSDLELERAARMTHLARAGGGSACGRYGMRTSTRIEDADCEHCLRSKAGREAARGRVVAVCGACGEHYTAMELGDCVWLRWSASPCPPDAVGDPDLERLAAARCDVEVRRCVRCRGELRVDAHLADRMRNALNGRAA